MAEKKNPRTKIANLLINSPDSEMPKNYGKFFRRQAETLDQRANKPPSTTKGKYIEVKGPFQIRSSEAASKISSEILRLAKKHPEAKFILRETHRKQGSGSVYSAVFKTLSRNDMGNRIHVVKAKYGRGYSHLGPPAKVREAKIAKLNAFKVAEFTYSGKVPSAEYKAWGEVDKSISKEKTWDPLRSKTPTHRVKKYVGGTASASKKVDAYLDRVSEYGRKKGAKQTSVDIAIEYIRDKSDEFAETQRYQNPSAEPIHMLSKDRLIRLDRLQKNYGTPQVQTGKVNLAGAGEKKIVPQVPIQTDPHKIYRSNITTSTKEKFKGEAKKGLPGTGHRESGTRTSFFPVGVSEGFDSGREFDGTSHMLPESDPNKPRYPEQSSERVYFENKQGMPKGNPNVNYSEYPIKKITQETIEGHKPISYPAKQSNKWYRPERKTTQFPFISEVTGKNLIVNEFSKLSSGLKQWDKHKGELDSPHSITPSDEFKKSDFESPDIASSDKGGGGNIETHTDEFMDKQGQGLRDDLSNIEKKPWLIDSVKIGDSKKATKTTSITDVLYGDAISPDTNPKTGTQDKVPSSTSPHSVSDPIKPYRKADPTLPLTVRRTKKPVSAERKRAERIANLQGEGTHIELRKNKMGVEYPVLKTNEDGISSHTRAQQIKKNYIEFRNKALTDFNAKIAGGEVASKIDTSDVTSVKITKGTHSPMKTFSLVKPKNVPKGASAGSIIRKGFGLGGIASLFIAPVLAVREVKAAGGELTVGNVASETTRFMLGSDRVWSGYGAKNKGYFQKVGLTNQGVPRRVRHQGPIEGAGGPNTPYAKLKKSISGAMIEWSNASSKASEALKYRRHR